MCLCLCVCVFKSACSLSVEITFPVTAFLGAKQSYTCRGGDGLSRGPLCLFWTNSRPLSAPELASQADLGFPAFPLGETYIPHPAEWASTFLTGWSSHYTGIRRRNWSASTKQLHIGQGVLLSCRHTGQDFCCCDLGSVYRQR